ncbi:D-alanine--D-alanine ligase family protein [Candidatus Magnetominusculus xianensis]|uniref:D-alanine--D-alanine ligase n=1 Tax=Candidatus Magnetominusculus xianensis TaxID=1748249 RepID=A0ABR5SD22_9BACT|nr:D-alanine--D-alanine ligase [Candidatus Magnetominusculus xianensis]KWT78137.1 D-alanine--D-alanine ligase [Candidatus Magnetominusculus xianensis]MBF0403969.1 D-alanine--D-alanine ligase [Nitrospirota bacterium]
MNIGLTFDLRKTYEAMGFSKEETAEFDSEETIDYLEEAIKNAGHRVSRIGNIRDLVENLAAGARWDLVFNISEGMYGRSREAQIPALLEAYGIDYTFSDPLTLALSLDKAMAKAVVRASGAPTPDYIVVDSMDFTALPPLRGFPVFVKPLSEGTGKGIDTASVVRGESDFKERCEFILKTYRQPAIVEEYLPGREFTVGIIGTGKNARAVGTLEVKLLDNAEPLVYSYANKEFCEERVKYILCRDEALVKNASEIALTAYRSLGCRDAGRVDLKCDEAGRLSFIEINPLAGLHPSHSDLPILCALNGIGYDELISLIIHSAIERCIEPGANEWWKGNCENSNRS